jgi:hypothetical protein
MPRTLKRLFLKIAEINRRYKEPRIEMSAAVKASLMFLRAYLMVLVCLMVYKFIVLLK